MKRQRSSVFQNVSAISITSPLSSTAMEHSCPQATFTTTLFCRQLLTLRGVGWLAVDPEPT